MKLFVDSSAWIALFDASNKYHRIARINFNRLLGQELTLITSDYVIDEAITLLLNRGGHKKAVQFGVWLLAANNIDVLHVNEEVWQDTWFLFQAYDDKEWAFTDCTSFALMRQHNLWQAFTFDHHFEQAGFQLWPKIMRDSRLGDYSISNFPISNLLKCKVVVLQALLA